MKLTVKYLLNMKQKDISVKYSDKELDECYRWIIAWRMICMNKVIFRDFEGTMAYRLKRNEYPSL